MPNLSAIEIKSVVRATTGLRVSPRLQACTDILWTFLPLGRFGRIEVMGPRSGLSRIHHPDTLKRAMRDLERAGLMVPAGKRPYQGGGMLYTAALPALAQD